MTAPTIAATTIRTAVQNDPFWETYLQQLETTEAAAVGLHLAILVNPYLQLILDGRKTIESRFSIQRRAPYKQVDTGDIVLLKRSGGAIQGIGLVGEVEFFRLTPGVLDEIQARYGEALGVTDPSFWTSRASSSFATLLHLQQVRTIPPISYAKRDQRAWIVLHQRTTQTQFWREGGSL